MTHTNEQERAEFEAWYRSKNNGSEWYSEDQWEAWQAARRAQVVQDEVEKLREELAEEADAANNWRRLALQFDNHRMHAIWHLKHVLHPCGGQDERDHAEEFLKAPPLDGEAVLAERIAALAVAPQPPEAAPVVPQFSKVAKKKLDYLLEAGEEITGYAIQNKDGRRGAIDCHGFVYWWQEAAPVQMPLHAAEMVCSDLVGFLQFNEAAMQHTRVDGVQKLYTEHQVRQLLAAHGMK